jgi:hypothetical protein
MKKTIVDSLRFNYSSDCTVHETAEFKLKDLNFTGYWRDKNGNIIHKFFDFWTELSQDYKFTAEVFSLLLDRPFFSQFSKMILWSDGELKTKEILYYFSKAAASHQIHCQLNFFASYHGHSICDGHFGAGKKRLRVKVGAGVENKEQIIEVFNSIKNTTAGTLTMYNNYQLLHLSPKKSNATISSILLQQKKNTTYV